MNKERVSIFIDGSNFYNGSKVLNILGKVNFQKLIDELVRGRALIGVFYYVKIADAENRGL